ncbi:MAG: cell division protein FtsQ/DivIB [Candidatus Villigracilaceae bacterium]
MRPSTPHPTRAELVRQRRLQENARRQQTVVTRLRQRPAVRESSQAVRTPRRYQASVMAVPRVHAQTQTQVLPRLRPGWRLLSGTLILLIVLGLYLAWTSPLFAVSEAGVVGAQRISAEEINAALNLKDVPVFLIAPQILSASLLRSFPDLEAVSVKVELPARITINLRERQPVIAWIENNAMTWVDAQGYAFRPRGAMPGLVTVVASGRPASVSLEPQTRFLPPDLVRAFQKMAPHVPAGTPILYDPQYGLGWNDERGWKVYFGASTDDLALKLHIYEALINFLTQRGVRPALVSVMYPNAPFYRLEP